MNIDPGLTLNPGAYNVTGYSSCIMTVSQNKTFTLVAENGLGAASKSIDITVTPVSEIAINPSFREMIVGSANGFARRITIAGGYDSSVRVEPQCFHEVYLFHSGK